ncbi:MAG: right-handed parallel beta-helix repeat-containing protein, partial [Myxococcota bacterium]|nr:right-handed parallel beta-helix repeat-containing protein [Myxococcota bacterium]
ECVPEACGTGTWGDLQTDGDTIYVDASAEAGGDGSKDRPFTVIQEGLDAQGEDGMVAVAAGTYVENLQMNSDHSGVHLAGRCMELVTIDGSEGDEENWETGSGIYLNGRLTTTWTVSGVTVTESPWVGIFNEYGALLLARSSVTENRVRGINTEGGSLTATDCVVQGNHGIGVSLFDSTVTLEGVQVLDTQPDASGWSGRGIAVQYGSLAATACLLQGNHDVGLFVYGSSATLQDVQIVETRPGSNGQIGVGVAIQDHSTLEATDCVVRGNHDMGLFIAGSSATLHGVQVLETRRDTLSTAAIGVGAQAESTVMATNLDVQNTDGPALYAVANALLSCTNCTLTDNAFAGAVVQLGGELSLEASLIEGTVPGSSAGAGLGVFVDGKKSITYGLPTVTLLDS